MQHNSRGASEEGERQCIFVSFCWRDTWHKQEESASRFTSANYREPGETWYQGGWRECKHSQATVAGAGGEGGGGGGGRGREAQWHITIGQVHRQRAVRGAKCARHKQIATMCPLLVLVLCDCLCVCMSL